ncbi:hypothetical protein BDV93DRAFT_238390 [Ceratobasidium sp. AG-I]|nr:hypothetical protein BDV93DRAFT_238390 [Ceratobasidium sp. AG-I]
MVVQALCFATRTRSAHASVRHLSVSATVYAPSKSPLRCRLWLTIPAPRTTVHNHTKGCSPNSGSFNAGSAADSLHAGPDHPARAVVIPPFRLRLRNWNFRSAFTVIRSSCTRSDIATPATGALPSLAKTAIQRRFPHVCSSIRSVRLESIRSN